MKPQKSYSRLELEAELKKGGKKELESDIQKAFFDWAFAHENKFPVLKLMFAVPNGSHKSPAARALFQRTGLRPGVPDICLPVSSIIHEDGVTDRFCIGLWIEFKVKGRTTSPEQKLFIQRLRDKGHEVQIHFSWITAVNALIGYLHLPIEPLHE